MCYINVVLMKVLSTSVVNYFGNPHTKETESFVCHMDRFFNCLKVRSFSEVNQKLKRKSKAIYSTPPEHCRLQVGIIIILILLPYFVFMLLILLFLVARR